MANSIKTKVKKVFRSVGLYLKEDDSYPESLDASSYQLVEDEIKIRAHLDFLSSLAENEENRLNSIESKTSQLIAQTGIIFSLLGLFIPIIMDKASAFQLWIKVILLLLLLIAFFFYLLTIHNALRNYQINKFNYSRPGANNVLEFMNNTVEEFHAETVRDLLSCIKKNAHINNKKGTNLLHSYKAFKIANLTTGILVGLFSISILFLDERKETVSLEGPVEIRKMDVIIRQLDRLDKHMKLEKKKDTIMIINR